MRARQRAGRVRWAHGPRRVAVNSQRISRSRSKPVIDLNDIYSLSDFQRKTREHIERLRGTRKPAVLTVNGKAELVVQDASAYQDLLDLVDRAEAIIGIQRGLDSMHRGEGEPLDEAIAKIRASVPVRRTA